MDDKKLLVELRAQRELIRKHLEWLDLKIDGIVGEASESGNLPTKIADQDQSDNDSKQITDQTSGDEALAEDRDEVVAADEDEAERRFQTYKAPTGDDILRAKIGCVALFILSTLLFLFLLFGLPYLID